MVHNCNVFGSCIINILYIYSTNIGTEYFKHGIYSPFFSSSKCSLLHNSNVFGSCIIHILYTECAKIKKNNSGAKRLSHDLFRPNSVQFINQSLNYWQRREINHQEIIMCSSSSSSRLTHWLLCLTPPTLWQRTNSECFESAQGSVGRSVGRTESKTASQQARRQTRYLQHQHKHKVISEMMHWSHVSPTRWDEFSWLCVHQTIS